MIATRQIKDQVLTSWGTIQASFPPTPPDEAEISLQWPDSTHEANHPKSSSFKSTPVVAIVGVGYVGAHLVEVFAHHYQVVAFDIDENRLKDVAKQIPNLPIRFTSCAADLSEATHVLISVPTALNQDKAIDTTYLRSAVATVERYIKPGSTIVVESSVAVGMTRQLVGPLMARKGVKVGMSPERVDPGRVSPAFKDIPKIISGLDVASLEAISQLYGRVFTTLLQVSSPEIAEMTKLYENCQRMVCAAYANEMADACVTLGIDAWEVSQAAASKPFGYIPFSPGPGVGGHCIPVNPYYLLSTCSMPILEHATKNSWERPTEITKRFMDALFKDGNLRSPTKTGKLVRPRVLVVGVGFKRGQSVMSNSPGVSIISALLSEWDVHVEFADPLVPAENLSYVPKFDTTIHWNRRCLGTFNGIIVAVDQIGLEMSMLDQLPGVTVHDYSKFSRSQAVQSTGKGIRSDLARVFI